MSTATNNTTPTAAGGSSDSDLVLIRPTAAAGGSGLSQIRPNAAAAAGSDSDLSLIRPQGLFRPPATSTADRDDQQQLPTELQVVDSSRSFAVISPDKLSVKYPTAGKHGHDVGAVQANKPAPAKSRRSLYYFEILVKDAGSRGCIAIGFTKRGFNLNRQPGWEADSIGYHGDDGLLYHHAVADPGFSESKNGEMVGAVRKDIKGVLFPTVALHSQNEEIEVNFGQKPFAFDIIQEKEGWISMATALTAEVISAVFEQQGRRALPAMVLAYSGLLLSGVALLRQARRQRVVWERRGLIPWFYSSRFPLQHRLFGSVALYFELSAAIWQTFHSTVGYVYASRWNRGNPVRMSVTMILFGIFVLVATVVKRFPALFNTPQRRQQNYHP